MQELQYHKYVNVFARGQYSSRWPILKRSQTSNDSAHDICEIWHISRPTISLYRWCSFYTVCECFILLLFLWNHNAQTIFIIFLYYRLTSPLILIVVAGVAYACHRIRAAATTVQLWFVPNRTLTTAQQCAAVSVASVPLLYLAGAGAAMFWVMGASWFVVSAHAIFYNIDAIVTEDETDGFVV